MAETMFCPRCGKQFSSGTSFCRKCGLGLDRVSEIVSGEASTAPETRTRPNWNALRVGFGLFILGTVLGLANIIVRDLGLFPEIYGKIVFLACIIAGMASMGLSLVFPKKYYKRKTPADSHETSQARVLSTGRFAGLPSADRNMGEIGTVSSVTEQTTRNLR